MKKAGQGGGPLLGRSFRPGEGVSHSSAPGHRSTLVHYSGGLWSCIFLFEALQGKWVMRGVGGTPHEVVGRFGCGRTLVRLPRMRPSAAQGPLMCSLSNTSRAELEVSYSTQRYCFDFRVFPPHNGANSIGRQPDLLSCKDRMYWVSIVAITKNVFVGTQRFKSRVALLNRNEACFSHSFQNACACNMWTQTAQPGAYKRTHKSPPSHLRHSAPLPHASTDGDPGRLRGFGPEPSLVLDHQSGHLGLARILERGISHIPPGPCHCLDYVITSVWPMQVIACGRGVMIDV